VLDAYPDLKIPAHVISIVPTADRQKATVRVRIGLDQLDPRILPDMGIKVSFFDDSSQPANAVVLQIPENALGKEGDGRFVWVVRDGKVEKRAVTVGEPKVGQVPVSKGIEGGETIVIDAPGRLRDGAAVELQAAP
jgi:multidrug efflux pump subunit AcrA (membrane-fusion protein)